ncbi:hypothetical protein KIN20_016243 [Parelaphostrongylus tenuis]|uniref:FH2 domain-containing protein n=1 Tax=Parelaphostrongylus tenuis TaxID=148309 RepID=A0AAD5MKZ2_PARTN|nr:hypothetical protein KIN20_016243 [Parelaphostrongylus tenuis]
MILQHLTLKATVQGMADVENVFTTTIDINEILARLHTQCDYERLQSEMERLKEELDLERMRVVELDNRIADIHDGRASISSRISTSSSSPTDPCPSLSPLPPVCPPAAAPPPPPPPPCGLGVTTHGETQKRVPKPSGPLKSFNWVKFSETKVKGTAWEFIEDEKMYKQLDLENVATTFASCSQKDEDNDIYSTMSRRHYDTQISVIDPRRYQNCTIMLSRLKLSHREIRAALIAMDDKGKLPKDMLEQDEYGCFITLSTFAKRFPKKECCKDLKDSYCLEQHLGYMMDELDVLTIILQSFTILGAHYVDGRCFDSVSIKLSQPI